MVFPHKPLAFGFDHSVNQQVMKVVMVSMLESSCKSKLNSLKLAYEQTNITEEAKMKGALNMPRIFFRDLEFDFLATVHMNHMTLSMITLPTMMITRVG